MKKNPMRHSIASRNHEMIKNRMKECGLWDYNNNRPIFGWAPILFFWHIASYQKSQNATPVVLINGVPWSHPTVIPYNGESPYAKSAHKYCPQWGSEE